MQDLEWVGVDCHKDTIACYKGNQFKEFKTTKKGFDSAQKWAGKNSKWALEGAYCFGRPFTAYLIKNNCQVYEVNPLLTKTWRRCIDISGNKDDWGDAKAINLLARNSELHPVSLETVKLKELLTSRKFLVHQRTGIINHLKSLHYVRGEKLAGNVESKRGLEILLKSDDIITSSLASQLICIRQSIQELEREINRILPEKARRLTSLTGINIINAATIYTELKGKLASKASLAKFAGVAPIGNSSGKTNTHLNNKAGNRILNTVFYTMSLHQSRYDKLGKAYYHKKLDEGKSPRHSRKCLARRLVNIVWNILND